MYYKYAKDVSQMTPKAQAEVELINKVQLYGDRSAMRKLVNDYQGAMRNAIKNHNVEMRANITYEQALSECERVFRDAVMKYDQSTQPNTYLIHQLNFAMQHYIQNHDGNVVSVSGADNGIAGYVARAIPILQAKEMPVTGKNLETVIRNDLGAGGNYLTAKKIDSYRSKLRTELSGNRQVSDDASFMTFDDMYYDSAGITGEEIAANNIERERVEQAIKDGDFTRSEKKYLCALLGVGQFKNKPPMNKNAAAIAAGITYAQGGSAINKLRKMLDGR